MKTLYKFAMLVLLLGVLAPFVVQAAVPRIMLEKSASYALNDSVHAFRVPTQDNAGVIKFYDVIIDLNVNSNGTIATTANVVSSPSPSVTTGIIVPGTYRETGGADTCTVTNMTLSNGRIQSFFRCSNGAAVFEFSVATGPISAGHPYLSELLAYKVNLRSDVATQTWGVTTGGGFFLGTCNAGSTVGRAIGAKTNGSQIVISVMRYTGSSTPPNLLCGNTLNKI